MFGREASRFAAALAEALTALDQSPRRVRVALRHAPSFTWMTPTPAGEELVTTSPDSLLDAVTALEARAHEAPWTIGVGPAFALGVRARLTVWIRDAPRAPGSIPVDLVLEEPRLELAGPLALELLRGPVSPPGRSHPGSLGRGDSEL